MNTVKNRFGFPYLGHGLGLRTDHYDDILGKWPKVDWFEIISENYMDTDGRPKRILEQIVEHYPVIMHGVGLSIGSTHRLNREYLKKLKALMGWVKPHWVSDHLCWTGVQGKETHDLLPMPYTKESLKHVIGRIKRVQEVIEAPLVLENPSTYLEFEESELTEWDFIAHMATESGCGLLLDVNNVYVSAFNHGFDPKRYIDAIPAEHIVQIHLAGHVNHGTHIIDTHSDFVIDEVWDLYRYTLEHKGLVSTLVEWDSEIPSFGVLCEEVAKARNITRKLKSVKSPSQHLKVRYEEFQRLLLHGSSPQNIGAWIKSRPEMPAKEKFNIYVDAYRIRLKESLKEDFPVIGSLLGEEFEALIGDYVEKVYSEHFNMARYSFHLPNFISSQKKLKHRECLAELAKIEVEFCQLLDEQEDEALELKLIKSLNPETLMTKSIRPVSNLRLLNFEYAIEKCLDDFANERELKFPPKRVCRMAVFRSLDSNHWMVLEPHEHELLEFMSQSTSLGEALESWVLKKIVSVDKIVEKLPMWFERWATSGLLTEKIKK